MNRGELGDSEEFSRRIEMAGKDNEEAMLNRWDTGFMLRDGIGCVNDGQNVVGGSYLGIG